MLAFSDLPDVPTTTPTIASSLAIIAIALHGVWSHFSRKRAKASTAASTTATGSRVTAQVEALFKANELEHERRFNVVTAAVVEVKTLCVGADGQNGFRSTMLENRRRIEAIETRERQRLERGPFTHQRLGDG